MKSTNVFTPMPRTAIKPAITKEIILLVYQKGLSQIFEKHIFDSAINGRYIFDKEQSYSSARVSGSIFGMTNEWVRRGMQDSPEYLAKFLNKEIEYKTI